MTARFPRSMGRCFGTLLLALPAAAALLPGCGSGGEGTAGRRLSIRSEAALDGWIRSDGELDTRGGGPGVGDLADNQEVRTFYSFPLTDVPPNAEIEDAILRFAQVFRVGTPLNLDPLLIESIDYGDGLEAGDFTLLPLATPHSLTLNGLNEVKSVDVTLLVQADVDAGRLRSQFRLRMEAGSDGNFREDFIALETEDNANGSGERPALEVRWRAQP